MKHKLMVSVAAMALAAGSTFAMAQGQGGGGQGPAGPGGGAGTQMQQGAPGGGAAPGGAAPRGAMSKDAPGTLNESPAPGPSKGAQERGSQPNQKATQDRTAPASKQKSTQDRTVPDTKQKTTQERNAAPTEKQRSTEQAPAQGSKQDKSAQTPSSGTTKQGAAKGEMKSSNVSLTTEQKTTIRNTVVNNGPKVTNVNFNISVGTVVPRSVRVVPVPATLVSIEPSWRDHMYFIYGDEVIIVEAGTMRIIAVLVV